MSAPVAIVFANLKGNLGDFAILHSVLADIDAKVPLSDRHVYSHPFVRVDEERLDAFSQFAPRFHYMGTLEGGLKPIRPLMLRVLRTTGLLNRYQALRTARLARRAAANYSEVFKRYRAIFIVGGAQWTGVESGVSMFANLRAIAASKRPVLMYPVSVSSAIRKVNPAGIVRQDLLLVSSPLIVRDSDSQAVLSRIGVKSHLGADCVFGLPYVKSPRQSPTRQNDKRLLMVVTKQAAADIEAAVLRCRALGWTVALLSTCVCEDETVQLRVATGLGVQFLAPATWQDAVSEMAKSTLVVTNRLHGLIFASIAGSAVIPLVNRSKVRAVAQDALLPVRLESLAELDEGLILRAANDLVGLSGALQVYAQNARRMRWSPLDITDQEHRT